MKGNSYYEMEYLMVVRDFGVLFVNFLLDGCGNLGLEGGSEFYGF